jgi:hypothetical protein
MKRRIPALPEHNRRCLGVLRIGSTAVHRPKVNDGDRCPLHGRQRAVMHTDRTRRICWPCFVELHTTITPGRDEAATHG